MRKEAKDWFNFLDQLQLKKTDFWAGDAFRVFSLINKHRPEEIIGEMINNIPVAVFIHRTNGGTAVGGTRSWLYPSISDFLCDGLRLSSGMTYKTIWARLPPAGGKAVICGTQREVPEDDFCEGYAELLNDINVDNVLSDELQAKFITGEDIGCGEDFVDKVANYTCYIVGKSRGFGGLGDPSPRTAKGTFLAIKALVENTDIFDGKLQDKICAVQGAGKVALPAIKALLEAGAVVYFSENDGDPSAETRAKEAQELGATRAAKDDIYSFANDIFMPFAVGGVINKQTISMLNSSCRLVAGAANNILETPEDGIALHQRGINFAPDYVINRRGLEWVTQEKNGITDFVQAEANMSDIPSDALNIYALSKEKNIPASEIADIIAEKILRGEASSIEEAFEQL